jgi:hypothetical protein
MKITELYSKLLNLGYALGSFGCQGMILSAVTQSLFVEPNRDAHPLPATPPPAPLS